jgi:hypothetical protein
MNVFTQSIVDQGLVVAPAGGVNLVTKPGQDVVVDANGDAGLSRRRRVKCSPFTLAEVLFLFHSLSLICLAL